MKAFIPFLALASFSVFAADIEKTVATLHKEKECLTKGERTKVTVQTNRSENKGQHYFGVTSHGDIAVLEDNNKVTLYLCPRSEPVLLGEIFQEIGVTKSEFKGCSVPQITKLTAKLGSEHLYFRWLQADESSLCNDKNDTSVVFSEEKKIAPEICDEESKGSIMELTQDVIEADSKMNHKKLKKWFKQKVDKDDKSNVYGEFRYTADFPLQCEQSEEKSSELVYGGNSFGAFGNCKGLKMINREVNPLKEGSKKSENKFLAQVFSKKDGEIKRVEHVAQQKGLGQSEFYIVHKQLKNGDKVKYKIDPNINAAYNPVEIVNETKKKIEGSQLQQMMGFGMNSNFGMMF